MRSLLHKMALASVLVLSLATAAQADSLSDALVRAYNDNPDLASARAQLRAVDEQAPQARAGMMPSVTANAAVNRTHEESDVGGKDDYTTRSGQLVVQQPLFRGGRTVAAIKQADSVIAAQQARLLNAEQSVLLSGVEAYLNVVRDQAVLDLNTNNESVLARQLKAVKDRFSVGEVTRTDVSQAKARLASAKSARIQAEGNLTSSRASYQRIFGVAPADLSKPAMGLAMPESLETVVAAAVKNNPTALVGVHNKAAAEAALSGVKGERLPTLTAQGSVARSYDAGSSTMNKADSLSAGVSLNWPLYTGGATSSRIREAQQEVSRYKSDLQSAERSTTEVATQSWEQWKTAQSVVESRRSQVEASQIALNGVQEEAKVGSRTVLDTLNAEQEHLDARVALVRAEHDEILSQYQLLAAMGHLTAQELKLPVAIYDETAYSKRVRRQWIGSRVD